MHQEIHDQIKIVVQRVNSTKIALEGIKDLHKKN